MREIKFRAWDEDAKQMITWEEIDEADKRGVAQFLDMLQESQFKVMQYTGLKDRNGVEIYEGDILNISPYQEEEHTVKVYKEYAALIIDTPFSDAHDWTPIGYYVHHFGEHTMEIIGNIYEHPHLLTKEE